MAGACKEQVRLVSVKAERPNHPSRYQGLVVVVVVVVGGGSSTTTTTHTYRPFRLKIYRSVVGNMWALWTGPWWCSCLNATETETAQTVWNGTKPWCEPYFTIFKPKSMVQSGRPRKDLHFPASFCQENARFSELKHGLVLLQPSKSLADC